MGAHPVSGAVIATVVVGSLTFLGTVLAAAIALRSAKLAKAVERVIAADSNATENRKVDLSTLIATVEALERDVGTLRQRLSDAEDATEAERARVREERTMRHHAEAAAEEARELARHATQEARDCAQEARETAAANQAELARFRAAAERHGWQVPTDNDDGDEQPDLS